jgi:hypothetical protein
VPTTTFTADLDEKSEVTTHAIEDVKFGGDEEKGNPVI